MQACEPVSSDDSRLISTLCSYIILYRTGGDERPDDRLPRDLSRVSRDCHAMCVVPRGATEDRARRGA